MKSIPVVILCGGNGLFIDDSGIRRNKALVEIKGVPMFLHVIGIYLRAGYRAFILATGYQGEKVLDYVMGPLKGTKIDAGGQALGVKWRGTEFTIQCVDTGERTTTGDRLKKVQPYLGDSSRFCVSYSDTFADVDPGKIQAFHEAHGKVATVLGTPNPTRFRILGIRPGDDLVRGFAPAPVLQNNIINGGFYVFERNIFDEKYFGTAEKVVLEDHVLEALVARKELVSYLFEGHWRYLDCERDLAALEKCVAP